MIAQRARVFVTQVLDGLEDQFFAGDGTGALYVELLRRLARGRPVPPGELAAAVGTSPERLAEFRAVFPDLEVDERGDIVGAGLTLRPTAHVLEIEGRRLYTWCALDTLLFPAVLGVEARVSSPCAGTGAPVQLLVRPAEVAEVEPVGAVVSLVRPRGACNLRSGFCERVHFFVSPAAASSWLAANPEGVLLPVSEAHRLVGPFARLLTVSSANAHGCC